MGGVKSGPMRYCFISVDALRARNAGVKSIRSSIGDALAIERRRLGRKGLRRRRPLAGRIGRWHRPLFDRPDRLTVGPIEDERERLLRHLHDGLDSPAVNRDVRKDWRCRQIVVPEVVVNDLVVPDSLAGGASDAHQGVRKQIVSETVPAAYVIGRAREREIGKPRAPRPR